MKKRLSLLLAIAMTAFIFAGCNKEEEAPDINVIKPTEATTPATTTEAPVTTTPEPVTTTAATTTVPETETEDETTTMVSDDVQSAQPSESTDAWKESAISGEYYVDQSCYSRKNAIIGSDTVVKYERGDKVTVVALTDTGYYKLEDGTFIHSDYLTQREPVTATTPPPTATTPKPTATTPKPTATAAPQTTRPEATVSVNPNATYAFKVHYTQRQGYKQLSKEQQQLYANFVEAANNLSATVALPKGLDNADVYKVYCLFYNTEAQMFWLSPSVPTISGGNVRIGYIVSNKTDLAALQKELSNKANELVRKANAYSSSFSKVKVFYDHIITSNSFSESGDGWSGTAYNGILGKPDGLQCGGYAKSIQYLCDLAGIDCTIVTGNRPDGWSHAWNKIYIDNGWYNLDSTWGDPVGANYIRYNFFFVPDAWIVNSHLNPGTMVRSSGEKVTLYKPVAADKTAANYFRVQGMEYSDLASAKAGLLAEFDKAFKVKSNIAHIRVTDKKIYDALLTNAMAAEFSKYAIANGKATSLSRQTTYNDGVLVVQYKINY